MGADTGDPSLIQNDDLLCMENRADTLGHNDDGGVVCLGFQGSSFKAFRRAASVL